MPKRKIKELKSSPVLTRDVEIRNRAIDEENRTVEIAFSSEEPVLRYGEEEVLDHNPESVRLERALSNGPLLMDHEWRDQIGIIEKVEIGADRVGRAVVRFGKSERASEIFQDVVDGIRKSISVGYRIWKVKQEERNEDQPDRYRVMDWEPLELSFVSVPADINVGVGRALERGSDDQNEYTLIRTLEETKMSKEKIENSNGGNSHVVNEADRSAAIQADRDADAKRRNAIRSIAATYPDHDLLVQDALRNDIPVEEFAMKIGDAEIKRRENDVPDTHLDLTNDQVRNYSVSRALMAQVTGNWKGAEFEREASNEIADRLGIEARGVLVPYDVQNRVVTTTGAGVGAVGTNTLGGSFIDLFRDRSLLTQLGATTLTGLTGNVDIPKKTGSATFEWVAEDTAGSLTDVTIGTLALSPKTVTGSVAISRRSLLQSTPDIDALVMADMAQGAALAVDVAGLSAAAGGNDPTGILNTTGVLTSTVSVAGQPTWAEIVAFETAAAAANSLAANSSWITTAAVRGFMKTTKKDAGSGIFLIEGGQLNGYPVNVKTDAGFAANTILFGDFSQVMLAMWGVLDLVPDTSTKISTGGLVIRVFQDMDIGVRQPTAFVKNV